MSMKGQQKMIIAVTVTAIIFFLLYFINKASVAKKNQTIWQSWKSQFAFFLSEDDTVNIEITNG